jgi:hypothetical protein
MEHRELVLERSEQQGQVQVVEQEIMRHLQGTVAVPVFSLLVFLPLKLQLLQ